MPVIKTVLTIGVLAAIAGSILFLEARKAHNPAGIPAGASDLALASTDERVQKKAQIFEAGKDISTPDAFINAEPFSIADFVGSKVVLVDFWTYSCINCQRTLPYLNDWHAKYADDGLVIIGVHTPEFDFERDYANVQRAVEKWGIEYPVVLDNDYSTWSAYRNRYWPRKYLLDIDGFIAYDHIGEGGYEETEKKIVDLLNERKRVLGELGVVEAHPGTPVADSVNFEMVKTRESYLGSARIEYLVNLPAQSCLSGACTYTLSEETPPNSFELSGEWSLDNEYASLTSSTGAIRLRFSAGKVNLVAGSLSGVRAEIYLDGVRIGAQNAGTAVSGGSVLFKDHDLYNIVDLHGKYGEHVLEIRFAEPGIRAFAFTFG